MAWVYLLFASAMEVAWAVGLKWTNGFTRFWPSVYVFATGVASVLLLGRATKTLPVGTAYAVWTGLGAAGTAVLAMFIHGESRDAGRLVGIAVIIAGVILLKLVSPE